MGKEVVRKYSRPRRRSHSRRSRSLFGGLFKMPRRRKLFGIF